MNLENNYDITIGSDEAGKGEWLGPMAVVAVALTPEQSTLLKIEGVMDSKKLSLERILDLAKKIEDNCSESYVVKITPSRFNQFLEEIKREGKSLNDMLAWGHAKAIEQVYSKVAARKRGLIVNIVIDEFDKLKTEMRLKRVLELKDINVIQKPRAEEEIAVAAASILARAVCERWIDMESTRTNVDLRSLSPSEALDRKDVVSFAKVSFLRK